MRSRRRSVARIRTTRQAQKLRPMATVLAARHRFWKHAEQLLGPNGTFSHEGHMKYLDLLGEKFLAEQNYMKQGGKLRELRGAHVLEVGKP